MEDILLKKFFEKERWERAINTGMSKHINKCELEKLTRPEFRLFLYNAIKNNEYEIAPPHQAKIPKDNGDFRIVYVNENVDRVVLSIINDLFFECFPSFIHPSCKSYQTGLSCGKVVKEVSTYITNEINTNDIGVKLDLTKYFDSVRIEDIDCIFTRMEQIVGPSKIINIIKKYYHSDICFDYNGNLIEHYQSLKQGCAVASFLADAVLYNIDEAMSKESGYYVRYSDDLLILGNNWKRNYSFIKGMLYYMGLTLNPNKVEYLTKDKWFKFLGFNIKNDMITLSKARVKTFQKEIEKRTIKKKNPNYKNSLNSVINYLYKGTGEYSWSTSVLSVINVEKDINILNMFVMDALRATQTNKKRIGGLGSVTDKEDYTVMRGTGKNVKNNRLKTDKNLDGYLTLGCMHKAIITNKNLFKTLVSSL